MTTHAAQLQTIAGQPGLRHRPNVTFRSLSEDRDHWRERARAAERALRGDQWHVRLHPYTLFETRVLRLLERHELCSYEMLLHALYIGYSNEPSDIRTIRTLMTRIRRKIPKRITIEAVWGSGYAARNRPALSVYLTGLTTLPPTKQPAKKATA